MKEFDFAELYQKMYERCEEDGKWCSNCNNYNHDNCKFKEKCCRGNIYENFEDHWEAIK